MTWCVVIWVAPRDGSDHISDLRWFPVFFVLIEITALSRGSLSTDRYCGPIYRTRVSQFRRSTLATFTAQTSLAMQMRLPRFQKSKYPGRLWSSSLSVRRKMWLIVFLFRFFINEIYRIAIYKLYIRIVAVLIELWTCVGTCWSMTPVWALCSPDILKTLVRSRNFGKIQVYFKLQRCKCTFITLPRAAHDFISGRVRA